MDIFIFLFFVFVALYFKFRFHQTVKKVQDISTQQDLMVFETKYKSANQMGNNIIFLNQLWSVNSIKKIDNLVLRVELLEARKLFRYQLGFGFLAFLSVVVNGFLSA